MIRRAAVVFICLMLGACGAFDAMSTSVKGTGPGVQAVLRPSNGGSGQADVRFVDRGNGVLVTMFATNLLPGTYRLAVQRDANCSSPNLFSAGPAWAPPGSVKPPQELIPVIFANSDGDVTWSSQVPGLKTTGPDGVMGHSVVLYSGSRVEDAQPGVPNNRLMCGILGPSLSFLS